MPSAEPVIKPGDKVLPLLSSTQDPEISIDLEQAGFGLGHCVRHGTPCQHACAVSTEGAWADFRVRCTPNNSSVEQSFTREQASCCSFYDDGPE
jgi:hypothetical protein